MHPIELLGEWVMWNLVSIRLEIVLVLVQDRCTVCVEYTIRSKLILDIILDAPYTQVKARFSPFGHSANLDTR